MINIEVIRKNPESVNWYDISKSQKLSEDFIREFKDYVFWHYIFRYQKLSENFIREFKDRSQWYFICINQKLSEDFIREHGHEPVLRRLAGLSWGYISIFQKLSEDFIREFKDYVDWHYISKYQKLSEGFIREFNLEIPDTCWLYKSAAEKEQYIREHTNYEIIDGEVIAYKSCRAEGYSKYNFQYKYEVGKEYESHADYNECNEDSFGLSAWTREKALEYCGEKLFKVAIKLEDIACVVQDGNKLRASKLRIIEEVAL